MQSCSVLAVARNLWGTPVLFPQGSQSEDSGELGQDHGPMNGSGHLLEHLIPRTT